MIYRGASQLPVMLEIPEAKNTDAEDVVWGLQTADTLWKRGERIDALVWLRRAAQAAGDANDDDRALELARFAAELTEEMAREIDDDPLPEDPESEPVQLAPPEDDDEPTNANEIATAPPPEEEPEEEARPSSSSVPPAAQVHAGMFDPWAEQAVPSSTPQSIDIESESSPSISIHPDEEIVTSVRPAALAAQRSSDAPPSGSFRASSQMPTAIPPLAPLPKVRPMPPPLPARAKPPLPVSAKPPVVEEEAEIEEEPTTAVAAVDAPAIGNGLDLEAVEAFADLPDDARSAFAAAATLHTLGDSEEIGGFALAYIVDGAVDVAATMVDATAARLVKGAVLRARGTTDENVLIRLIGVTGSASNIVATWSDTAVDTAFKSIPWVEEDLRAAADRVQTLVGITIGPLGERLDQSLREQILGRLTMRPLLAGDVVVKAGEPVPGLLLVGIGEIELVDANDKVTGIVGSGDFLFPTEVLGAGAAPSTARAGSGGALVMFGDRNVAQELLVTCPPLLEVFAGM